MPGRSGNPGGRRKGLGRRVRELVGEDGELIATYMLSVMLDERARTADRIEAGKWLADRGFGKAPVVVESGVRDDVVREFLRGLSTADLDAMIAILEKYPTVGAELPVSGPIPIGPSSLPSAR